MKARIPGRRALLKPDKQAVRDYVDKLLIDQVGVDFEREGDRE